MIIVGYQGIGKSTLAVTDRKFIDLESSNFFVDGKRDENWHIVYCNIAEHLSEQGYTVFMSSHKAVREELEDRAVNRAIICPSLELKDEWIKKLHVRFLHSFGETKVKNFKAWMNAVNMYEENINDLKSESQFLVKEITSMDYSLKDMTEEIADVFCQEWFKGLESTYRELASEDGGNNENNQD